MASRRLDAVEHAAQAFWRALAERAQWDPAAAAQLLGISRRSLERRCQRDLGHTPSEWFQHERMAAAAQHLTAGQPIKAVAAQLGYSQSANFSRDFKRHHGRTPRAFAPRLFPAAGLPANAAPPQPDAAG